jgi:hypothetical protein
LKLFAVLSSNANEFFFGRYILSINAIAKLNNVLKILQNDVKKISEKFQRKELKWQIVFVDSVKWKYVFHQAVGCFML